MDEKTISTLLSVGAGWLLASLTAMLKKWWSSRSLLAGLLTELDDIQDQLNRFELAHARQIQIYALGGIEGSAQLPIFNTYFKHYFKEAFSHLSRSQRISYQLIHATVDALNEKNQELTKFTLTAIDELRNEKDKEIRSNMLEAWGTRVIALYKTVMEIKWHIAYHLKNPEIPIFDIIGPMHESYLRFAQELDDRIKETIEKAKTLNKQSFEKIYDPEIFKNK